MKFRSRALALALALLIVSELLGVVGVADYGHGVLIRFLNPGNAFFGAAGLGAFWLFATDRPPRRDLVLAVATGLLAELALARWRSGTEGGSVGQGVGIGLALGGALVVLVRYARGRGEARAKYATLLSEMAMLPVFILLTGILLRFTITLHPSVLDTNVFAAEVGLGADTGFRLARWVQGDDAVAWILLVTYVLLPLAVAITYAAERSRGRSHGDVLAAFVVAGAFGYLAYNLCPVVGPRYFFRSSWPTRAPDVATLALGFLPYPFGEPRNCVPSLHTSWALLIFWRAKALGPGLRAFSTAFLILTIGATIGLGFHYVVDVAMAFPFSLAIHAALSRVRATSTARRDALVFGALLTVTWLVALRFGASFMARHAAWSAVLCAASAVGAWLLEMRLFRSSEPATHGPVSPASPT